MYRAIKNYDFFLLFFFLEYVVVDLSLGGERFYPVHPVYIPWIRRDHTDVTGLRSLESMVLSISNELTTDDFVKMKFLLEDHLPRCEIENAVRPYELFCLMIKYGILSSTYLNLLMELLRLAGRPDLLPVVTPLVVKGKLKCICEHNFRFNFP